MANPEAWARPFKYTTQYGGIEWPTQPLSIVCRKCRSPVDIEAWECDHCGEAFYWKAPKKIRPCLGRKPRAKSTVANSSSNSRVPSICIGSRERV